MLAKVTNPWASPQTKEILLFEKGEEQKVSYTRISLESPSLLNQADLPK